MIRATSGAVIAAALAVAAMCAFTPAAAPVVRPQPYLSVPVLLFHQVSNTPIESAHGVDLVQRPWATPAEFDALLAKLEAEGYASISSDELAQYIDGSLPATKLPRKPLSITFDDGFRSALTEATPILRKHHFTATMYFEGHAVDNPAIPGRLSTADLKAMAASGVWELQSHGFAGHSNLRIDASGTTTPYWYANLGYLPAAHRLETPAEFERRVEDDLRRMRTQYANVAPHMDVFAYPSGEFGQNVALAPGEDPKVRIEAGHSNATGLTELLVTALKAAGYRSAVAVSLPDTAHFAGPSDSIWTIPRIGVGAGFTASRLSELSDPGVELPEDADGHFIDVEPICASAGSIYAASTVRPILFRLDGTGKVIGEEHVPDLITGRPDGSPATGGLACDGHDLYLSQQAGFNPHPQPYLAHFTLDGATATYHGRVPLPAAMNWLTGIALLGHDLYGIDDRGTLFDVRGGKALASIETDGKDRDDRFTGLISSAGHLLTFDRKRSLLIAFTLSGAILSTQPLSAETRALAVEGTTLYSSNVRPDRRMLRRYVLENTP